MQWYHIRTCWDGRQKRFALKYMGHPVCGILFARTFASAKRFLKGDMQLTSSFSNTTRLWHVTKVNYIKMKFLEETFGSMWMDFGGILRDRRDSRSMRHPLCTEVSASLRDLHECGSFTWISPQFRLCVHGITPG
jgi:hypothetical protein